MTDPLSRFESVVDEQIRKAQERGDFEDEALSLLDSYAPLLHR